MTIETLKELLAAQEAALDAHRAAMPPEPVPDVDQRLWDATQAAVYALSAAVRSEAERAPLLAALSSAPPDLVSLVLAWQRAQVGPDRQAIYDALLAWSPAPPSQCRCLYTPCRCPTSPVVAPAPVDVEAFTCAECGHTGKPTVQNDVGWRCAGCGTVRHFKRPTGGGR